MKLRGCASGDEMLPKIRTALAPNEAYNRGRLYAGSSHSVSPERSRIPQKAPPLHIPFVAFTCCAHSPPASHSACQAALKEMPIDIHWSDHKALKAGSRRATGIYLLYADADLLTSSKRGQPAQDRLVVCLNLLH